jgi:hypothetical protein
MSGNDYMFVDSGSQFGHNTDGLQLEVRTSWHLNSSYAPHRTPVNGDILPEVHQVCSHYRIELNGASLRKRKRKAQREKMIRIEIQYNLNECAR